MRVAAPLPAAYIGAMPSPPAAHLPADHVFTAPAMIAGHGETVWVDADGTIESLPTREAAAQARRLRPIICHLGAVRARLAAPDLVAYDLLELFAFVLPARACLPSPAGIARALSLNRPETPEAEALVLLQATRALLDTVRKTAGEDGAGIATAMRQAGWPWGPAVVAALADGEAEPGRVFSALQVWNRLPEWGEAAPEPPAPDITISSREAMDRLVELLPPDAETRRQQLDYAAASAGAFRPRQYEGEPETVLAEAGTGVGKTLGYLAAASAWLVKGGGAVWISTFTKNLQRQIDQELAQVYPDPDIKRQKVVVRKGRENYLCLLNYQEALAGGAAQARDTIGLGLLARWIGASRDGDFGGDFPAWLTELVGARVTRNLADRRGECIHSACSHWRKCFIERSVAKARRAEFIIANHALVMIQAAMNPDGPAVPPRLIFDEGHHLFDAADSAFSAHLSGLETAELRRWLRADGGGRRGRSRGLRRRIEDLIGDDEAGLAALDEALSAAASLPGEGWQTRLRQDQSIGPAERFLGLVRRQVLARARSSGYSLECDTVEPVDGLMAAAAELGGALDELSAPLSRLTGRLAASLDEQAADLETATRQRIEAAVRGIQRRALLPLSAWRTMLNDLPDKRRDSTTAWFEVSRDDGREIDIGYHSHWIDPMAAFAELVLAPAHGALITSATLRDHQDEDDDGWDNAAARTGVAHLANPPALAGFASPFDHQANTRVVVVRDVRRDDEAQVAAAYRELFLAAGGGGLGLFTAIRRLRGVHDRIAGDLAASGLPLYAQHVDPIETGLLVDMFRADTASCLLGTDALRDGVDIPGPSLQLVVFDRVPWPRPTILHRARRERFGKGKYDDMLTRLRLKQAYGRMLRRQGDRGVFVVLDPMLPSRLLSAFPEGIEVLRTGLAEAVRLTGEFLTPQV